MTRTSAWIAFASLTWIGLTLPAQALTPHETFIVDQVPTSDQIAAWSALPGQRSYLFQLQDPGSSELSGLIALRGADRVELEVSSFPGEDTVAAYQALAARGDELVTLNAGFPTDDEIDRLNRIGFAQSIFVVSYYPGPEEAARLARLKGDLSITFVANMYPKYEDKAGLIALPPNVPLLYVNDYWPWYAHMDVSNMVPNPQSVRVTDMFPPADELQYLQNMHHLTEVTVDTDFEAPDPAVWKSFGKLPVRWSFRGRAPSADGLRAFEASAGPEQPRRLVIDSDTPLTDSERALLGRSPLNVEWIHAVY